MYGLDWVHPQPDHVPTPEKSPQEKALDDFIARREAARRAPQQPIGGWSFGQEQSSQVERDLDRAMKI